MAYVYIVKCCDETYYVGMTQNLRSRIQAHKNGRGAVYTRKRLPVELVYSITTTDPFTLEGEIKKLLKEEKETLIESWSGHPNERIQCSACNKDLTDNTAIANMNYPISNESHMCHQHCFCDIDCLKKFAQAI